MAKIDISKVVANVQKLYAKDPKLSKISMGTNLVGRTKEDFIEMPEWWKKGTNTYGLPFGGYVMIAGDSDSGKTSMAIAAMKAAQERPNCGIIYVETENKTSKEDLIAWGVDPSQIIIIKSAIAEEAFQMLFDVWSSYTNNYPDAELLVIFDSIGNVMSRHDMEMDMSTASQKPGGKGKANRQGINRLIAQCQEGRVAGVLINYTYDNIGSPGKTNAGGKSLNLFSSLTYQVSRKQWLEKTVKGEKVRIGAKVQWRLFKNHIDKSNPGPKVIELDITADGISLSGAQDDE